MNMIQTINRCARLTRTATLSCPFCGTDPLPAVLIARRYVIGCANEDCPVDLQASGDTAEEAWAKWNRRA